METTNKKGAWVQTDTGVRRRILCHTPELMMVEFEFQKGASGALHNHPHVQGTYVVEGEFAFSIDGEEQNLTVGDTLVIPSNAVHGCITSTGGRLIDTFTPLREDFL